MKTSKGFGKIELFITIALMGFLMLYKLGYVSPPKGSWNPFRWIVALHELLWGTK